LVFRLQANEYPLLADTVAKVFCIATQIFRAVRATIDAIAPSTAMTLIKMPVRDPSEIEAAIKTLGLEVPPSLLAHAHEMIE
jgi:hypothetical protein